MREDSRLNFIRAIAVVMIVFCHYFQIIGVTGGALWLNTGVQIFFVLSAYLMSKKRFKSQKDIWLFYAKRGWRVLLPMWIYLAFIVLALLLLRVFVSPTAILLYAIGGAGFAPVGVLGLGHFWYITVILICYLLVPMLDKLSCGKKCWLLALGLSAVAIGVMVLLNKSSYGINISLFILTYLFFRRREDAADNKGLKRPILLLLVPTVMFCTIRLILDAAEFSNPLVYSLYDGIFVTASKGLLGLFLFLVLLKTVKERENGSVVKFLSDQSYEIYLTHQFILLAVYEYVMPYFGENLLSKIGMLVISAALIWVNTVLLWRLARIFKVPAFCGRKQKPG